MDQPGIYDSKGLKVAIDSNVLTYLVQSARARYYPKSDQKDLGLRSQKKTIFFLSRYLDGLYVPPTVRAEVENIRHHKKTMSHMRWLDTQLVDILPQQCAGAVKRAKYFADYHKGKKQSKDCLVLAEAECSEMDVLLTFDNNFIEHLAQRTTLRLERPSGLWARLGILPGTRPRWGPAPGNPTASQRWRRH